MKIFVKGILTKCFCQFVSMFFWWEVKIVLLYWKEVAEGWRIFLCCILGYSVPKPQARLFPQLSWKSRGKRALSKNFSVILSVCWFTRENGESLHPILLDSFSIFISVISMQSDKWKIFGWHLFFFYGLQPPLVSPRSSPRASRAAPPIRGEISSLIGEGDPRLSGGGEVLSW